MEHTQNKIQTLKNEISQMEYAVKTGMLKNTLSGRDAKEFFDMISRRKNQLQILENSLNTSNNHK